MRFEAQDKPYQWQLPCLSVDLGGCPCPSRLTVRNVCPPAAAIFSLNYKEWPMFSSPAVPGDMVYNGSHQGKLLAVNAEAQKPAWAFATDGSKKNGAMCTRADGTPN